MKQILVRGKMAQEDRGLEEVLTRRSLIKTAVGSCLLLTLPMLAEAGPIVRWPPTHWEVAGPVGRFKLGVMMRIVLPGGTVAFVTRRDARHLTALSSVCTHQGCDVGWNALQEQFVCPCHASRYSAEGVVLRGPARRPLRMFAVMQKDGQVLIDVGPVGAALGART